MKMNAGLALSRNLNRLMRHHDLTQAELGARARIGQSTLSRLLNTDDPSGINPRAQTIDQLAEFFGIPPWMLLIPNLDAEVLTTSRLRDVIEHYTASTSAGRESIERVATAEAYFAKAKVRPGQRQD